MMRLAPLGANGIGIDMRKYRKLGKRRFKIAKRVVRRVNWRGNTGLTDRRGPAKWR